MASVAWGLPCCTFELVPTLQEAQLLSYPPHFHLSAASACILMRTANSFGPRGIEPHKAKEEEEPIVALLSRWVAET